MNIDVILYLLAFAFFIVEAAPISKGGWGFQWLAMAALVLSLVV